MYVPVWFSRTTACVKAPECTIVEVRRGIRLLHASAPRRLVKNVATRPECWGKLPSTAESCAMPTVMIVEDDPVLAHAMEAHLERAGFVVEVTADTLEALNRVEARSFDMLVVDVAMPPGKPSGLSFARMLRYRRSHSRIIFISGYPELADVAAQLPGKVFTKPVDLDAMVSEMHSQLQDRPSLALFDDLLGEAIAVTGADMGNLQVADPATGALRIVVSRGFGAAFLTFFAVVQGSDDSACGAALKQAGRVIVSDVTRSEIFMGNRSGEVLCEASVRAVQSTPILGRTGRLIGMISTHRRSVGMPSHDELARLDSVVRRAADEIETASWPLGSHLLNARLD